MSICFNSLLLFGGIRTVFQVYRKVGLFVKPPRQRVRSTPVIRKNKLSEILPLFFSIAGLLTARFMIIWLFPFTEKFKVIDILERNVQTGICLNRLSISIYSFNSFQYSHIFSAILLGIWHKVYNFGQRQLRRFSLMRLSFAFKISL